MRPPFEDDMNALPLKVVMYDDKTPPRLTVYADNGRFYVLSTDRRHVFTILRRMVDATNLMPEAARLLRSADEKLLALCRTCDNAMSDAGLGRFVDCKNCNVESLDTNIKELLAKLEGGADNEPR